MMSLVSVNVWIYLQNGPSSLKLADRQSFKLRELHVANVRTLVMDIYGSCDHCDHCVPVCCWWRWWCDWDREGWAPATGLCSHGWLTGWYSPWPGPRTSESSSSWPGSPDNEARCGDSREAHLSLLKTIKAMKKQKKQRKRTIRYFLSRSSEPCVSVCWCVILKL